MRLKAEIWVKAYIRRLAGDGVACFVVRRGDADAGAIFIRVNRLDGTSLVFGPAPAGLSDLEGGRGWVGLLGGLEVADEQAEAYLGDEVGFDPDVWIVEVEDRPGRHFLDEWFVDDQL